MISVPNKKTITTLAFRQIKTGKARNLFAIAAVALTSVLVTAVLTMGAGLLEANKQTLMKASGQKAEISFQYLLENEVKTISTHPLIKEYGLSKLITMTSEGAWNQTNLEIRTADSNFADMTYCTPTIGRLPRNENEVAVKSWMLDKLGLPHEVGQIFPLSFMIGDTRHDLALSVCGVWDDDYYMHPYGTAFISDSLADKLLAGVDAGQNRVNGDYSGVTQLYANLNGRQSDLQDNLDRLVLETGLDEALTVPRENYAYANTQLDLQSLAALFLIVLIVLISGYLLIHNIFYISVIRDIRHYGLLKTIGTTRPQIKRIVNVQAFIFCLIGIPIGLFLGYFLAAQLFPLILASTILDNNIEINPVPLTFVAAALLSFVTVFISCNHPAKIAGKISPVEATRYTDATPLQKKKTKRGYDGASIGRMAFANLFRNRKKTVITLASVSIGLILFNIVFTFANSYDVNKYLRSFLHGDFLIADGSYMNLVNNYSPAYTLSAETVAEIAALDGVTDVAKVYYEFNELIWDDGTYAPAQQIYGMDDYWLDRLEESVIVGTFDRDKFLSGKYAIIGSDPQNLFDIGDMVTLNLDGEASGTQYEVMAKIKITGSINALSARFTFHPDFLLICRKRSLQIVTRLILCLLP